MSHPLPKEIMDKIKADAKAFSAKYEGMDKFGDLEHGYIVGAQNAALHYQSIIEQKDKEISILRNARDEQARTIYFRNKEIEQLKAENERLNRKISSMTKSLPNGDL